MKHIIGIIAGTIAGAVIGYIFARKNEEVVCCCGCDASKCPDFVESPTNKFSDDGSNDNEDPNKFDSDDDGSSVEKCEDDYEG